MRVMCGGWHVGYWWLLARNRDAVASEARCSQARRPEPRKPRLMQGRSRPISRVLSWAAIHLGRVSRYVSCDLPGSRADHAFEALPRCPPIWSCSGRGLPCHLRCRRRGALLPHHFTLTPRAGARRGGIFSVALSMGSHPPGVTWRPVLWSPDFPPSRSGDRDSDCLANSEGGV